LHITALGDHAKYPRGRAETGALRACIEKKPTRIAPDLRCARGRGIAKRPDNIVGRSAQSPKTHTGRAEIGSDETVDVRRVNSD